MAATTSRRALHWLGTGLSLLGVAFVVVKFSQHGNLSALRGLGPRAWAILLALALGYGLSATLLAFAWRDVLAHLGVFVGRRWATRAYGVSQLAKYVPGNVVHLAGRQAIGAAAGIPGWPLAKSALWELATLSLTASFFGILAVPLLAEMFGPALAAGSFVLALSVYVWIAARWLSLHVARAVCCYAVFLTLSGLTFAGVLALNAPPRSGIWLSLVLPSGAYVISWLAGLVMPGAPAGMGVREFFLFALLRSTISQPDLLAAIVMARLVTVGGDTFFYLLSSLLLSGHAPGIRVRRHGCDRPAR